MERDADDPYGNVHVVGKRLNVYKLTINISLRDAALCSEINSYLKEQFGVWLLNTAPELTTLWPPTVVQDAEIPVARRTTKIFCAISSGNKDPDVFVYQGSKVFQAETHGNDVVLGIPTLETVIASVDRKYIGREVFYQKRTLPEHDFSYAITLEDIQGCPLAWSTLTHDDLARAAGIRTNAKIDLAIGSPNRIYQAVSIREEHAPLPPLQAPVEVNIIVEDAPIRTYRARIPEQKSSVNEAEKLICALKSLRRGPRVPVPAWVAQVVSAYRLSGNMTAVQAILNEIRDGRISLGALNMLLHVKLEDIQTGRR